VQQLALLDTELGLEDPDERDDVVRDGTSLLPPSEDVGE